MKLEPAANPVPTADTPLMELAALAIKSRDAYKLDAQNARTQQQQLQNDLERQKIEVERLTAQVARLTAELEESESNNQMLQKMIKRVLKDTKG